MIFATFVVNVILQAVSFNPTQMRITTLTWHRRIRYPAKPSQKSKAPMRLLTLGNASTKPRVSWCRSMTFCSLNFANTYLLEKVIAVQVRLPYSIHTALIPLIHQCQHWRNDVLHVARPLVHLLQHFFLLSYNYDTFVPLSMY
jgi:hypothetical protein